jgi:hypothetical protein
MDDVFSSIARRLIGAFERRWDYDGSYMREILDGAGWAALLPLDGLAKVSRYRRGVPAAVYYAAKLSAALAADCGPCLQLTVSQAEAEGVEAGLVRALIAGDRDALGAAERLGFDLARATLERAGAESVRAEILARYGHAGLVSLAYGIVAAQAFPAFKYALGHGAACTLVRLGGSHEAVTTHA